MVDLITEATTLVNTCTKRLIPVTGKVNADFYVRGRIKLWQYGFES